MVEDCEDSLLRRFDANQDYLWLWNPSRRKSGGILVGVKKDLYDVGLLDKEILCCKSICGINKIMLNGTCRLYMVLLMKKINPPF
jgi:hypothetical protein